MLEWQTGVGMSYNPDINEMVDEDVTNAGKWLVFNILIAIGSVITLIVIVALLVAVLKVWGFRSLLKWK